MILVKITENIKESADSKYPTKPNAPEDCQRGGLISYWQQTGTLATYIYRDDFVTQN